MNSGYNPKVSIIIPVYNGKNFLNEAIESAISQSYKNIEIIVVNDGSTDNGETENIAKSYGDKIKYFFKENGGVSSALNYGIRVMTGEYFSWLSHDDLYTPEKIENSVKVLQSQKTLCENLIIYCDGLWVKEDKTVIKPFHHYFDAGKVYSGIEVANIMAKKGTLYGCNFLIPRKAFYEIGFFNEKLRYSQDALMWYLLFLNGYSICSCSNQDVFGRLHRNQVTSTRKDLFIHDSMYIAKKLAPLLKNNNTLYFNYIKRLTRLNCEETVGYLINYALDQNILTPYQKFELKVHIFIGKKIYVVKSLVKELIIK